MTEQIPIIPEPEPLISWRNPLSHQPLLQNDEDFTAYLDHTREVVEALRPVGKEEELLTRLAVDASWLLSASNALEINHRALSGAELARAIRKQKIENKPQDELVSFNSDALACAAHHAAFLSTTGVKRAEGRASKPESIEWLGRHRYRLERTFSKHRADLKAVQKERVALAKETWKLKLQHREAYDSDIHGPFRDTEFDRIPCGLLDKLESIVTRKLPVPQMTRLMDTVADASRGDRDDVTRIRWFQGKCEHDMKLDFDTGDPEAGLQGEHRRRERENRERDDPDRK